jgi:hypothetical protein
MRRKTLLDPTMQWYRTLEFGMGKGKKVLGAFDKQENGDGVVSFQTKRKAAQRLTSEFKSVSLARQRLATVKRGEPKLAMQQRAV